ncbi:hypothetical protein Ancab_013026 [Ancistrocladus abbreviatus]
MAGQEFNGIIIIFSLIIATIITQFCIIQSQSTTGASAPAPSVDNCNGIFISYTYNNGRKLPPNLKKDPTHQPYRFESTLTVLNNGAEELKSWRVFVGFQHSEILVSASNAVLADGTILPAAVGNGTIFAGFPVSDLETGIETAGDTSQMEVLVNLVGTQFGVAQSGVPLPANVTLVNDGFLCPKPSIEESCFFDTGSEAKRWVVRVKNKESGFHCHFTVPLLPPYMILVITMYSAPSVPLLPPHEILVENVIHSRDSPSSLHLLMANLWSVEFGMLGDAEEMITQLAAGCAGRVDRDIKVIL